MPRKANWKRRMMMSGDGNPRIKKKRTDLTEDTGLGVSDLNNSNKFDSDCHNQVAGDTVLLNNSNNDCLRAPNEIANVSLRAPNLLENVSLRAPNLLENVSLRAPNEITNDSLRAPNEITNEIANDSLRAQNEITNELANEITNEITNEIANDSLQAQKVIENVSLRVPNLIENVSLRSQNDLTNGIPYEITNELSNVNTTNDFQTCSNISIFKCCFINFGSFDQSDDKFSVETRGNQCTCNSLLYLAMLSRCKCYRDIDLDHVLEVGDEAYAKTIETLKNTGRFRNMLLTLDEIPASVEFDNRKVNVNTGEVLVGIAVHNNEFHDVLTLQKGLEKCFTHSEFALIMIGAICSAVGWNGQTYIFFDSHSHGQSGLYEPNDDFGLSLQIAFRNIEDLVTYMYAFYSSLNIDLLSQFEILPLEFSDVLPEIMPIKHSELVDNNFDMFKVQEKMTKKLMEDYFDDQKKRTNLVAQKTDLKTKKSNYIKTYMQQKRKDPKFRSAERERGLKSKQQAREDEEFKQKETSDKREARKDPKFRSLERQKELKSKQQAREDEEFQQKETSDKREARKDPKFRSLERQRELKSKQQAREDEEFQQKETSDKREARKDPKFRSLERQRELKSKQQAREDEEFQQKETSDKREARKDPKFRSLERQRDLKSKQQAREDEEFQQKETSDKREARKDPKFRSLERQRELKSKQKAREDEEFQQKETSDKREARKDPKFRSLERQRELKSKQQAREDEEFQQKETSDKREARKDPKFRSLERQRELKSKQQAREDEEFQQKETSDKREARKDPKFRSLERQRELKSKQQAREDEEYQQKEAKNDVKRKRNKRSDDSFLELERLAKQAARQQNPHKDKLINKTSKAKQRTNDEYVQHEHHLKKVKSQGSTLNESIEKFDKVISVGPCYICTCCHQTWFAESVVKCSGLKTISPDMLKSCITNLKSVDNKEWICHTCANALKKNKIPRYAIANKMGFPNKPVELNLYPLEERLVSLRIPFMQIRQLPTGGQYSVKGNVVNVPVDVQPTINALPRNIEQTGTIAVKLKKKLSFKNCDFSENVRPLAVICALHYLMKTSEMYRSSGITVDNQWVKRIEEINKQQNQTERSLVDNDNTESEEESDNFSEIEEAEAVGNLDTLLDEIIDESNSLDKDFVFAPGEGQKPVSLYYDADAEYLAFPSIFCGQRRPDFKERSVPVHYSDIVKWELRSVDRRVAQSVPNLFFKLKKVQLKNVTDKVNLALRRCKSDGKAWTAKDILNPSVVKDLVRLDEGYYIFRTLRNSPVYLEKRKKDVFAMIRQIGLPSWFGSLSSADTKWNDLLKILGQLNDEKDYSEEDLNNMTWQDKTRLVQKDPVTCSRFFDYRVQQFFKIILKSEFSPIGILTDYFYRVEFQQRGSPHIHMLVWIEGAPKFKQDSEETIVNYVNKFISCSSNPSTGKEWVQLQVHKHSKTCRKGGHAVCRFGFPLPPLKKTMILEPLECDIEKYKAIYKEIQQKIDSLQEMENVENLTYEEFLQNVLEMTEEDYKKAIRSNLRGPKLFLERKPSEGRVNPYMKDVLSAWKANHDLQFVLDPYACAMYIVSYISKSQKGMSALLDQAAKEARQGNLGLKQQVRLIGNYFTNSVETCAQEAVYLLLQIPLTKATREVVFINTSQSEKRTFLLKTSDQLEKLSPDSTDIEADNAIKRYAKRPKALEHWCLADYMSQLEVIFPDKSSENEEVEEQSENEEVTPQTIDAEEKTAFKMTLKNGMVIRQRKNYRVIRYVRFYKKTDSENFYRERLMLFFPWRNETDLKQGCESYEQKYSIVSRIIEHKVKQYEHKAEELDKAIELAENEIDNFDEIAPGTEQVENEAAEEGIVDAEKYIHFNPDRQPDHINYDIGQDLGMPSAAVDLTSHAKRIPDDEYKSMLQSLNEKQREFFQHVTTWIKTKQEPLHAFLTGGAGVGKSVVVKALYQALHRYLCSVEGENPDEVRILLCAPTGKAAYNIGGVTLHNAFQIQPSKKLEEQTLSSDVLNSLRMRYRHLSVIMIDEISMVGNRMFSLLDTRLQKIMGNKQSFGGVSVIAIGDFFQLKPVFDGWIFEDLKRGMSALAPNLWREKFTFHELVEIMRQKDDLEFAHLLNRLRENELTQEDLDVLRTRTVENEETHQQQSAIHLFVENDLVDNYNVQHIMKLETEKVVVNAFDSVSGDVSEQIKNKLINSLPKKQAETANLAKEVQLAVGMTYDLTANIDVNDGLTNGSTCVVKLVEYKTESTRPSIVWVKFDDQRIGLASRRKYSHLFTRDIDKSWTPIFDIKRSFVYRQKSYDRIQFPLKPAAAKTIHKSQGDTLDRIVVNLNTKHRGKIPHIHYVALSRVRSLNGLHILDLNVDKIAVSECVKEEIKRLRTNAILKLCYTPLYKISNNCLKVVFNNARSFHAHSHDISAEPNILDADIVGIAETRLTQNEECCIPGFNVLTRIDQKQTDPRYRPAHGLALFGKSDQNVVKKHSFSNSEIEFITTVLSGLKGKIQVVVVYKAPSCTFQSFKHILLSELLPVLDVNATKTVIMGDFNFDIHVLSSNQGFLQFMQDTFECRQVISKATTVNKTKLDLIFIRESRESCIHADVIETYWSDHSVVYVAMEL